MNFDFEKYLTKPLLSVIAFYLDYPDAQKLSKICPNSEIEKYISKILEQSLRSSLYQIFGKYTLDFEKMLEKIGACISGEYLLKILIGEASVKKMEDTNLVIYIEDKEKLQECKKILNSFSIDMEPQVNSSAFIVYMVNSHIQRQQPMPTQRPTANLDINEPIIYCTGDASESYLSTIHSKTQNCQIETKINIVAMLRSKRAKNWSLKNKILKSQSISDKYSYENVYNYATKKLTTSP